jgi:hypothetical protein
MLPPTENVSSNRDNSLITEGLQDYDANCNETLQYVTTWKSLSKKSNAILVNFVYGIFHYIIILISIR